MIANLEEENGTRKIVFLAERIDAGTVPEFEKDIERIIEGISGPVVLDLSTVTFLDSSGLGSIIRLHKRLEDLGGISIQGARKPVRKVFDVTRTSRKIRVLEADHTA